MPRPLLSPMLGILFAGSMLVSGCETRTCASACQDIYFECNAGQGMVPVQIGKSQDEAYSECVTSCNTALYSVSRAVDADSSGDAIASYDLSEPDDAMNFIDCVQHQDLASPQCVTDYDSWCPWIRW